MHNAHTLQRHLINKNPEERHELLSSLDHVQRYLEAHLPLKAYLAACDLASNISIKSIIALGQAEQLFGDPSQFSPELFSHLVNQLAPVERFFESLGGIVGYHAEVLSLMHPDAKKETPSESIRYMHPEGVNLAEKDAHVKELVLFGILHQDKIAEFYPVGGAGDRLNLFDQKSASPLPACLLKFCGRTLLEGLIRDVQAREYLYYKLTGKNVTIPVALMTSQEKENRSHVEQLLLESNYFGRPKDSYKIFDQPLVPVITVEGKWVAHRPFSPMFKPGGHGVIWKVAKEAHVFDWLKSLGREFILVRQINNPISGTDHGLLGFLGKGLKEKKRFGFSSCKRVVNAPEGMNICVEKNVDGELSACITNIEYTDFFKAGVVDVPCEPNSRYSAYPANTNILFAHLPAIEEALKKCSIPGKLVNTKTKVQVTQADGLTREVGAGRLESTMQNIADFLEDPIKRPLEQGGQKQLSTFIVFNKRSKTLATTKELYVPGKDPLGTPEGCLYEKCCNDYELLAEYCKIKVSEVKDLKTFMEETPPFLFYYHPALGPLYDIIGQKLRGGHFEPGAEVEFELAELDVENLHVKGSLIVQADDPFSGACRLKNVRIDNAGIRHGPKVEYWKRDFQREGSAKILIHGNGMFVAEDVELPCNFEIIVPDGVCVRAYFENGHLSFSQEPVKANPWHYDRNLCLRKIT